MNMEKDIIDKPRHSVGFTRLEVTAREVIEKRVKPSGKKSNSGRIYLPSEWVGCTVIIVRIN
jgi:putative transposon-encoded protein